MIFKRMRIGNAGWIFLLVAGSVTTVVLFFYGAYVWTVVLALCMLWCIFTYNRYLNAIRTEMDHFMESLRYKDFTRHFDETAVPLERRWLREYFNQVNGMFRDMSKERETQFIHLKTIFEMVDTGILSYEVESGKVLWMNEAFKQMIDLPYLRSVHALSKKHPAFYDELIHLTSWTKRVFDLEQDASSQKILLTSRLFESNGQRYKLVAMQNISGELGDEASKAWQKLLRVLTHEIMNSVAPISSLSEVLKERLTTASAQPGSEFIGDLLTGIDTIKNRSEGLLRFTETYRQMSRITTVNKTTIQVSNLFEHVQTLFMPTLEKMGIELEVVLNDPLLSIAADEPLLQQVLINLVLNATDAVHHNPNPCITLIAEQVKEKVWLRVRDNGKGMGPEVLDHIFVPFFTTKKNGTGVGLSVSKHILLLHKAQIQVKTVVSEGTEFVLIFDGVE